MDQALRFKAMYSRLGFSVVDVAKFLQVTPRTVHAWISGRVRIPFAAYKLLRVQLHYELPGDSWQGWHLSAGRLYTPEGRELSPHDFTWWGLLVRKAALFTDLYARLSPKPATVAGRTATGTGCPAVRGPVAAAKSGPPAAGGRPAQPAGLDLSLRHFGTGKAKPQCSCGLRRCTLPRKGAIKHA
jgi:hypothetical protein